MNTRFNDNLHEMDFKVLANFSELKRLRDPATFGFSQWKGKSDIELLNLARIMAGVRPVKRPAEEVSTDEEVNILQKKIDLLKLEIQKIELMSKKKKPQPKVEYVQVPSTLLEEQFTSYNHMSEEEDFAKRIDGYESNIYQSQSSD